jgi:hypothetical protein
MVSDFTENRTEKSARHMPQFIAVVYSLETAQARSLRSFDILWRLLAVHL